jgi:hypothetical protein
VQKAREAWLIGEEEEEVDGSSDSSGGEAEGAWYGVNHQTCEWEESGVRRGVFARVWNWGKCGRSSLRPLRLP